MKKLLLTGALFISALSFSQTSLFADDFESGSGNWTLNFGGFGANDWVVNNAYLGSIFTSTPNQPGAITNSPQSQYLHIYNQSLACGSFGDCQAVFLAQSGGDKTAEMVSSVSTVGMNNVTFSFYYLIGGSPGATYGTVDYSLDNGVTWTVASPNYASTPNWTSASLSDPAWDNQAQIKFRFHWIESTVGSDPAYAVDQVEITAMTGGGGNTLTTGNVTPTSWCEGSDQSIQVPYSSTGTWNGGNTFSVELSDAAGSFAAPTVIGSVPSTAASGTISATVPGATPPGTGYRVRVVGSDPATTGTDNGSDLTINALPTVTMTSFAQVCVYDPFFTLTGGSPANGTYTGPGITANVFDPTAAGTGTHTITYTFTDGNGCSNSAQESIVVDACSGIEENAIEFELYPNPAQESFTVISDQTITNVTVMDMSGRTIKVYEPSGSYNVSNVPNGMYLIKVTSDSGVAVERLMIK